MPRKAIKACQGKEASDTLLLREWLRHPFSSTGLGSLCVFVCCCHNTGCCQPGSASMYYLYFSWHLICAVLYYYSPNRCTVQDTKFLVQMLFSVKLQYTLEFILCTRYCARWISRPKIRGMVATLETF